MSTSWFESLHSYFATRLPARIFVPCAGFLAVAGLAGGRPPGAIGLALAVGLAWLLLLQFRLLDDLSDLGHDRRAHPERVLAGAPSLAPFHTLLAVSFSANLALVAGQSGPGRLGVFLILSGAAFLWYGPVRSLLAGKLLGYHVVLGKYPVFVLLLSGEVEDRWRLTLAMALVYLCFSIYEVLHDRALHLVPGVSTALGIEIGAFFIVAELMALELLGRGLAAVALQGVLGLAALIFLGELVRRRPLPESARVGYLVFALGLALLLNFTVGGRS